MSITLQLPTELEHQLLTEAERLNLPVEDYIVRILSFHPFLENPPTNGEELVTYWERVGVINSRPDIQDSQQVARQLRNQTQHRESV